MNRHASGHGLTPVHPEMLAHWSDAEGCWCTHDHGVYRFTYATQALRKVFRLPPKTDSVQGRLKDALARSWLKRTFWPGPGIQDLVELPSRDVLVFYDRIYWYSAARHESCAQVLPDPLTPPIATPLRGGVAVHPKSQCAYFGEYLNGHNRDIRVCRVDVQAQTVQACWTFARSEIKHVHAIHYDRFRNRLWICTGDLNHESSFYYTDDEFATVHRFAGGDQSWRAIAVLFDESGMEWGMDAGKDAPAEAINRIYRYDFATGQRTECATIGNPAYAACEFTDGTAMLQTTYEPGRLQDTPEEAGLWFRGPDRQWRQCLALPHAPHPRPGVSPYASISLPKGTSPAGALLCTPVNCQTGHYTLMEFRWPSLQKLA
ncbi:hypothetical protein [Hydrogenophaga sp. PBL-H3]|uniref:hypothetical protein n=1 Tax=Hydrogenophaga sp. PBL-H3 TaxID=434010 RepID=UPI00132046C7|nr:hypothetical protein [Hydrogenophaga sp. PBL-H3]QHE76717.1 hypothetical protein F9Z45_11930 [Hydrogenophaga sp. PBL-H3]QHE81141.1 hypothetical protein F9Z44_11930 [Hydrogenophaga sp. PBL-H3]